MSEFTNNHDDAANLAWGEEIRKAYPEYFTTYPECGKGWDKIIRDFFDVVVKQVPNAADFSLLQLKEKFGELRIYFSLSENVSDEARQAVHEAYDVASRASLNTCEVTGEPGQLVVRQHVWMVRSDALIQPGDVEPKIRQTVAIELDGQPAQMNFYGE